MQGTRRKNEIIERMNGLFSQGRLCAAEAGSILGIYTVALSLVSCTLPAGLPNTAQSLTRFPQSQAAPEININLQEDQRQNVTLYALSLLNTVYRYGSAHPTQGVDCSGLVSYIFKHATGLQLPHNAAAIALLAKRINRQQLRPGDIVFFNTLNRPFSHIGIYIGQERFLHAPRIGTTVRIDSLNNRYYAPRFEGGGTLFQ